MNEMRSNVYCTNCGREFIATLDLSLNGNHVIECPHCQHEHYRVVRNGEVTEDRWRSSSAGLPPGPIYTAITSTTVTVNLTTNINFSTATVTSWLSRTDLNLT